MELQHHFIYDTPTGPLIASSTGLEFSNVYCYDINSYYIYMLLRSKYPTYFIRYKTEITSGALRNKDYTFYGKVRLKNVKAKSSKCLPMYAPESKDLVQENVELAGKRVYSAGTIEFYCFLREEIELLTKYYNFDEVKATDITDIWVSKLAPLPDDVKEIITKQFEIKQDAKGTIAYDFEKVKLNRIFGWFLTKKIYNVKEYCKEEIEELSEEDRKRYYERVKYNGELVPRSREIPYQVGLYLICKCKRALGLAINEYCSSNGFLSDLVSAHTDSIKATVELPSNFVNNNEIGKFKLENIMRRYKCLGNTRAAYIDENGLLGMKHGGIDIEDIELFLKDKTFDDITLNSTFLKTIDKKIIVEPNGTRIGRKQVISKFMEE